MKLVSWKLIAILVVLVAATFIVLHQPGESSREGSTGKYLVHYDSSAVNKVDISSPREHIVLEKEAGVWKITEPMNAKANQTAIASAVGKGASLEISKPVSTNPQNQSLFQVDSAGTLVRIFTNGNQDAAFRVGKTGPTFVDTYVRAEGSNDVYLTANLGTMFTRPLTDWRDKTIFKTEQDFIKEVSFRYGDTTFALAFKDSTWEVDGRKASEGSVRGFLGTLSNFATDALIDSTPSALPPLTAVITVGETQIRFYQQPDGKKYFVQTSQSPQWFEVQQWRASQVLKREKDFFITTS
jgi:hypothetical protein